MLSKEWLEEQVIKLSDGLDGAMRLTEASGAALNRAMREHEEAVETAKTILGCIRGLREELDRVERGEPCEGICPPS